MENKESLQIKIEDLKGQINDIEAHLYNRHDSYASQLIIGHINEKIKEYEHLILVMDKHPKLPIDQ